MHMYAFVVVLKEMLLSCVVTDHSFKRVKVCLSPDELQMCVSGLPLSGHYITSHVCSQLSLLFYCVLKLISK